MEEKISRSRAWTSIRGDNKIKNTGGKKKQTTGRKGEEKSREIYLLETCESIVETWAERV